MSKRKAPLNYSSSHFSDDSDQDPDRHSSPPPAEQTQQRSNSNNSGTSQVNVLLQQMLKKKPAVGSSTLSHPALLAQAHKESNSGLKRPTIKLNLSRRYPQQQKPMGQQDRKGKASQPAHRQPNPTFRVATIILLPYGTTTESDSDNPEHWDDENHLPISVPILNSTKLPTRTEIQKLCLMQLGKQDHQTGIEFSKDWSFQQCARISSTSGSQFTSKLFQLSSELEDSVDGVDSNSPFHLSSPHQTLYNHPRTHSVTHSLHQIATVHPPASSSTTPVITPPSTTNIAIDLTAESEHESHVDLDIEMSTPSPAPSPSLLQVCSSPTSPALNSNVGDMMEINPSDSFALDPTVENPWVGSQVFEF
ncbi:hypothetical protein PAXINDRAFT_17042 [Paxillus involutus ATCC 200175]|uniref:Uncharacterized protein n=1 Tax=Paxillus involutus ATCC 200175 TaxID=664439 RepID=A0A0C9SQT9_PAXIN|nr:hypothetical protein PAXINDRAFT_17042 [Paxillus involutus ATCC 200175]